MGRTIRRTYLVFGIVCNYLHIIMYITYTMYTVIRIHIYANILARKLYKYECLFELFHSGRISGEAHILD